MRAGRRPRACPDGKPRSPGRWGTLANVISQSGPAGRYGPVPCRSSGSPYGCVGSRPTWIECGARYLRGSAAEPPLGGEAGTLSDHPALIHLTMTAWSKVFRRDFLAGLGVSFGPAPHEDVPVTTLALLAAGRIGVLDRVCYRYRRARRGSYLATASAANFNIFGSYQRIFDLFSERAGLPAPAIPPAVYTAVFERAIWHYTTLLPLVPRRRRREFFRRMSADFRRWRPAGYQFPPGPRGAKFRLVARGAYGAYALIDPVNRLRVRLRGRK